MDRVVLNVGGKIFHTTRATLRMDPSSMLAKMFDEDSPLSASVKDENGAWFIDRDPKYFRVILNFLRNPAIATVAIDSGISADGVMQEAVYFQIQGLVDELQRLPDFTRSEICIHKSDLTKYAGVRLHGLDLSGLDFSNNEFQGSIITRTNFSHCNLKLTDFTHSVGTGANFSYCTGTDIHFKDSELSDTNFSRSSVNLCNWNKTNLTNATFLEADCEGSFFQRANLTGAIFVNASLKHAKFQNAILKNTDFSGANLKHCHFSAAELTGAKNINWSFHKTMMVKNALISQEEYDEIPLSEEEKLLLKLRIIGEEENM